MHESDGIGYVRPDMKNHFTLTKSPVTMADQAEIAYLLSSSKFSKATGQIISVDGGLHKAFLR